MKAVEAGSSTAVSSTLGSSNPVLSGIKFLICLQHENTKTIHLAEAAPAFQKWPGHCK